MSRTLSNTEIGTALECPVRHAFAYTGQLTGGTVLKPKTAAPVLRRGRAWGRAVAAYNANVLATDALALGHTALDEALAEDADEQTAAGVYDPEAHAEMGGLLHRILDHYAEENAPLPIDRLEHEIVVGIPSRTGVQRSSRYRLQAFVDGLCEEDGRTWIYEAKLRGQLGSLAVISLSRQIRLYAWAVREATGIEAAGVIVDERLADAPKPARILKSGKPSHAKDQLTTPALYRAVCVEAGVEPEPETLEALAMRRWGARHRIIFRPGELDEAGRQLVAAGQLIGMLDSGALFPIRNPGQQRCPGCPFRDACPNPEDTDLIDALYDRRAPKRYREEVPVAA